MKAIPVKFEIYDDEELMGVVSLSPEGAAEVKTRDCFYDVERWREFSAQVEWCLNQMDMVVE